MDEVPPPLLSPGDVIDHRYELVSRLARGGMGAVWRTRDLRLRRDVAMKIVEAGHQDDPLRADRIHLEAQALAQLAHSNIAVIYDMGTICGRLDSPYLVMELIHGKPLSRVARELPWPLAADVVARVADGLACAHARGIVHRDMSAANVLLTMTGVKLIDFGICATTGADDAVDEGRVVGTVAYMAPERLHGRPVDPAVDVYALGVLLYLLLTGDLPWPRQGGGVEGIQADIDAMLRRRPPLMGRDLPASIRELCRRCLHRDPFRRPGAAQVASSLRRAGARWDSPTVTMLLAQPEVLTAPMPAATPALARTVRADVRQRSAGHRRMAVAAAACSIIGIAAWPLSRWSPAPSPDLDAVAPAIPAQVANSIACHATYQPVRSRDGKVDAKFTITNLGTESLPAGWRVLVSLAGAHVATAAAPGPIAPRQPQELDLAGEGAANRAHPDRFWLNGNACAGTFLDPAPSGPAKSTPSVASEASGKAPGKTGKGQRNKSKPASEHRPPSPHSSR